MYRASWRVTIIACDLSAESKEAISRLQKVLGGKGDRQKRIVDGEISEGLHYWSSELRDFNLSLPADEICKLLFTIRSIVAHIESESYLNVCITSSSKEEYAGFSIPSSIVVAAASLNATIDVSID